MLKKINRSITFPIIYKIGIPEFLLKRAKKNLILCYHGVTKTPNFKINNRHIDLKQFEKDIIFYKKIFNIVPLSQMFESNQNKNSKPLLALTFDDGYVNNFENVFQICENHKVPVTFFIITEGLDDNQFITWYDLLDFIKYSKPKTIEFDGNNYVLSDNGGYYFNGELIDNKIKSMGFTRNKALHELYLKYQSNIDEMKKTYPEYWKLVDRKQLSHNIKNTFLTIGSHTHSHYNLGNIETELAESEITRSKKILEEICGYKISSIAYPDGNYSELIKSLAKKNDFTFQLAVDYHFESDLVDKNILRRYSVSNSTTHEANMLKLALGIQKFGL